MLKSFSNLRIGVKLTLAFSAVIVISVAALLASLLANNAQATASAYAATHLIPGRVAIFNAVGWMRGVDDFGAYIMLDTDSKMAASRLQDYRDGVKRLNGYVDTAERFATTGAEHEAISQFRTAFAKYFAGNEQAFAMHAKHQFSQGAKFYMTVPYDPAINALESYVPLVQKEIDASDAQVANLRSISDILGFALGSLALLLGALIAFTITRSIVRPLRNAVQAADAIAQGDLSSTIVASSHDETGQLLMAMEKMRERLAAIVREVQKVVGSANEGNFKVQADKRGMAGFQTDILNGLDALIQTTDAGLTDVARVLSSLAKGDLTERITADYSGAFGRLKDDANGTSDSLTAVVEKIRTAVDLVNTASQEIAIGNTDLSQRTEEQASSLEETASSMEELTSTVKQNSDNARQANQLAIGASEIAVKGGEVVGGVVTTMASINESSKKIVDIISVIDGIAFQTNILALNAAVEAARAGEQGRGFAVVAGEVRNLAQRSAAAAKEIKGLISDSVEKTDAGSRLVDQAGKTMEEIVRAVKRVTEIMSEIAAASDEQTAGIEQVNQAITQMDRVTQQNAALVEEAAAAATSLEEQARDLVGTVSVFRTAGEDLGFSARKTDSPARATRSPQSGNGRRHAPRPTASRATAVTANGQSEHHSIESSQDEDHWESL